MDQPPFQPYSGSNEKMMRAIPEHLQGKTQPWMDMKVELCSPLRSRLEAMNSNTSPIYNLTELSGNFSVK